ncbi:MAG: Xaa-Pro peptidase family protein [Chloroflexi bacterium]|nr:Xaa-Pro peptidase family protein [Chloroflexota bacterium]MCL5075397.1 Xaa-Pro peptidase family protein [Chloroflexota bacterium]
MLLNKRRTYEIMEEQHLEALIATTPENVYYTSQSWSPTHWSLRHDVQVYVVLFKDEAIAPVLIMPLGNVGLAIDALAEGYELIPYGTFHIVTTGTKLEGWSERIRKIIEDPCQPDPIDTLVKVLNERGLVRGTIGIDERNLTDDHLNRLRNSLDKVELKPAYALLKRIRQVKTDEEIKRIRRSIGVIEAAVAHSLAAARVGVTEAQLARELEKAVVAGGARPLFTVIAGGQNSAYPASHPSDRKLEKGDILRFDVGCRYEHYCSDIARTAILGEPAEKQRSYYMAILEGEQRALRELAPGVPVKHIFEVAVKAVRQAGIPHYKRNHCGHGIGLDLYETLLVAPNDATVLEEGMVVNIETPYYELGFGGLQVEDTALITADGYTCLTTIERDLRSVPV